MENNQTIYDDVLVPENQPTLNIFNEPAHKLWTHNEGDLTWDHSVPTPNILLGDENMHDNDCIPGTPNINQGLESSAR